MSYCFAFSVIFLYHTQFEQELTKTDMSLSFCQPLKELYPALRHSEVSVTFRLCWLSHALLLLVCYENSPNNAHSKQTRSFHLLTNELLHSQGDNIFFLIKYQLRIIHSNEPVVLTMKPHTINCTEHDYHGDMEFEDN